MSNLIRKIILSRAITGATHTPSMSRYLPLTQTIIEQLSIDAAEAAAAILHLHARDPLDNPPTPPPAVLSHLARPLLRRRTRSSASKTGAVHTGPLHSGSCPADC